PNCAAGCVWLVSATPAAFASTLSTTGPNPVLTLYAGWRYEAQDDFFQFHPWEMINTSGADLVLLSQRADGGTLRSDPSIAWVDGQATSGVSRFTLSPSLQSALTAYRCGVHTTVMRSPVSIQTR